MEPISNTHKTLTKRTGESVVTSEYKLEYKFKNIHGHSNARTQ